MTLNRPSEYTMDDLVPELREWLDNMADGAPDAHPRARQAAEFLEKLDAAALGLWWDAPPVRFATISPVASPYTAPLMATFERELADLLNRHSMDTCHDTSDLTLAKYLVSCLENRLAAKASS